MRMMTHNGTGQTLAADATASSHLASLAAWRQAAVRLLLTKREAAAALSISERSLDELVAQGQIQALRFPGRGAARSLRFAVSELERWIAETMKAQNEGT
jgi:excisionase family DNA binding protein